MLYPGCGQFGPGQQSCAEVAKENFEKEICYEFKNFQLDGVFLSDGSAGLGGVSRDRG